MSDNIILKKPSIEFNAMVNDECFVAVESQHNIKSYYVRIKPATKILMYNKEGKMGISNRLIKIPYFQFKRINAFIPKKNSIIQVKGYFGQTNRLDFYFQLENIVL